MTLTSVGWLTKHIEDPTIRVLDVRWYLADPGRGRADYDDSHIPGAVFLDLESDLSDATEPDAGRHPLPDAHRLGERLAALGVGDEHTVIAYDHGPGSVAARAWWLLRHLGHEDVSVLDGGMAAWRSGDGPLTAEAPRHVPTVFTVNRRAEDTVTMGRVAELGSAVLLDARAAERFRGEIEPVDPVAGHIPGARNLPYTDLVAADQRLLPPSELAMRFASCGVREDSEVFVACGSGVNACLLVLAALRAGLPEPRLYPGSYSQWSRAGMAVEVDG